MKKILLSLLIPLIAFSGFSFAKAADTTGNLIANPSAEISDASGKLPLNWQKSSWGTNNPTFTYKKEVTTGQKSLLVKMNSFSSGDAKWFFDPVAVSPNTQYLYSDSSKASVSTEVVAQVLDSSGVASYLYLGNIPASTTWKTSNFIVTTPASVQKLTIFHLISQVGTLETDNFVLQKYDAIVTPDGIPNGSLEQASVVNSSLPKEWQSSAWGVNKTTFSYQSSGYNGMRSIKITMANYSSGDAKWYYTPQKVTPGASYAFRNYYQSNVQSEVILMVNKSDGSTSYTTLALVPASTTWAPFSKKFVMPAGAVTASIMQVIYKNGYLTTDDYALSTYVPQKFSRGLISLTFDDAWGSQYSNALPLLKKYNDNATFYILTGSLGDPDYMTLAQVKALSAAGMEIGSHTVSHPYLTMVTSTILTNELNKSKNFLGTNIGPIYNFAAPYGDVNPAVTTQIKKYYRSNRSVNDGYNSPDDCDPYNIKVQNILQTTTLAEVQSWVDQAKANNYWLVLVYHQVDNSGDTYGTTPTNFEAQLSAIKASGLTVKTMNQALDEVTPQIKI